MIGDKLNYSDVFFRNMTASVLDILEGEVYWEYEFSSGVREVVVPFYYSLTGDEKYLLDTFTDDVVSDNRLTELNTDVTPRGVVTWTGFDIVTDELANPNVWMKVDLEDKEEVKKVLARVKPYPIVSKYELVLILNSENDVFKCAEALMDTLGIYKYFQFHYRNMNILGVVQFPESHQFEKGREINSTTKNEVKYTMNFEVKSYYPAFRKIRMAKNRTELNDNWSDSYVYDPFKKEEDAVIIPRRTKWYSNIYKAIGNPDNKRDMDNINGNAL